MTSDVAPGDGPDGGDDGDSRAGEVKQPGLVDAGHLRDFKTPTRRSLMQQSAKYSLSFDTHFCGKLPRPGPEGNVTI